MSNVSYMSGYALSFSEAAGSLLTLSAGAYAWRHLGEASKAGWSRYGVYHTVVAIAEAIPLVGLVAGAIELLAVALFARPPTIKVASFNMAGPNDLLEKLPEGLGEETPAEVRKKVEEVYFARRKLFMKDFLEKVKPDIVCLQEIGKAPLQETEEQKNKPRSPEAEEQRRLRKEADAIQKDFEEHLEGLGYRLVYSQDGVGVLYKTALFTAEYAEVSEGEGGAYCSVRLIHTQQRATFDVASMHVPFRAETQHILSSLKQISKTADAAPEQAADAAPHEADLKIIAGDLNDNTEKRRNERQPLFTNLGYTEATSNSEIHSSMTRMHPTKITDASISQERELTPVKIDHIYGCSPKNKLPSPRWILDPNSLTSPWSGTEVNIQKYGVVPPHTLPFWQGFGNYATQTKTHQLAASDHSPVLSEITWTPDNH